MLSSSDVSASIQTPSLGNEKKMNKQWVSIGDEMIQNLVRMHEVWWVWLIAWCKSQCFLTSELYSIGRGPRSQLRGFFSLWMNQDSNNSRGDRNCSESSISADDQSIWCCSCHACFTKAEAFVSQLCTALLCSFSLSTRERPDWPM